MIQDQLFSYRPIGILKSPYSRRIDAPHQSTVVEGTETGDFALATLELQEWLDEKVIQDLSGFDRLWLIFAFHLSEGWKSSVKPPRGGPKRGVLATRSPHRPNSIGLSAVGCQIPAVVPGASNRTACALLAVESGVAS